MAFPPLSLQRSLANSARLSQVKATLKRNWPTSVMDDSAPPALASQPGLSMPAGHLAIERLWERV
jgi:hypothetical protein